MLLPIGKPFKNEFRDRLKSGEKMIGAWGQLSNASSTEILARSGLDFVLIDMEHGPGDISLLISQLQAMNGYGCTPIVRAPWNDFVTIKRILDIGAWGIHVPYVNTAEEAKKAVAACLYPPQGIRGTAFSPRANGYGAAGNEYLQRANDEILIYVALETLQAIDQLDEMLKIDRLDGIFIGPTDLSTSMGYLGNPNHPRVQAAIARIEEMVLASGKFLGTIASDYSSAKALFDRGYQLVIAMSDSTIISKSSAALVKQFREDFAK